MMKLPIPFGNPRTYLGHSGIDYGQPRGTVFRASGPGTVRTLGRNTRGGFYIWVQYDDGPLVGYHHMDSHTGCPDAGTRVTEGTQLGHVGSLGLFSTGPHLHSEISGHATAEGYWQFFDRNRVVGAQPASDDFDIITEQEQEQDMLRFKAKNYYVAGVNDVETISKAEAVALTHASPGGARFAVVSSAEANLIIEGIHRREARRLRRIAAATGDIDPRPLLDALAADFDQMCAAETGFSAQDAEAERSLDQIPPALNP